MGKIIFILGGVRSGKSNFALKISQKQKNVLFVATAKPFDSEMKEKIKKHKKDRPKNIKTLEVVDTLFEIYKENFNTAIVDCLTLHVSNKILNGIKDVEIISEIKKFLISMKDKNKNVIIVSNEVGCGIVPKNKLARRFRDILGNVNQLVSAFADKVYYMTAGIPVQIKRRQND
ncbi:MAG: bifunctional adenosylcobinamide kinase/adenosylcobinamide-phosphate guanylyltransferase [Elusimicrobiota bacterium]